MARFRFEQEVNGHLKVEIQTSEPFEVEAYFVPVESPGVVLKRETSRVKLLKYLPTSSILQVYPLQTVSRSSNFLRPKYRQIRTLTFNVQELSYPVDSADFESMLEDLPRGFAKDFNFGLGLLKDCDRVIRLIEDHTPCTEIHFSDSKDFGAKDSVFYFPLDRFNAIWTEIQRINGRGNQATARVKDAFVHNELGAPLNLTHKKYGLGRHPDSRFVAKSAAGLEVLSEAEQDALIRTVVNETPMLAASQPRKFLKLHREIELVSLERLIQAFQDALDQRWSENSWQTFFDDNSFALQQVFGAPMVSVQSKASVGGGGLTGSGEKIADYLYKNSLTNNIALVEIKKPDTQLLNNTEYRPGVVGASRELNEAVTQVLDQAYQLTTSLSMLKQNSRQWDLESYAIACFVVAGRTPDNNAHHRLKSFELYRANSRNVTIVTYDEILERLKLLHEFLGKRNSLERLHLMQVCAVSTRRFRLPEPRSAYCSETYWLIIACGCCGR